MTSSTGLAAATAAALGQGEGHVAYLLRRLREEGAVTNGGSGRRSRDMTEGDAAALVVAALGSWGEGAREGVERYLALARTSPGAGEPGRPWAGANGATFGGALAESLAWVGGAGAGGDLAVTLYGPVAAAVIHDGRRRVTFGMAPVDLVDLAAYAEAVGGAPGGGASVARHLSARQVRLVALTLAGSQPRLPGHDGLALLRGGRGCRSRGPASRRRTGS